MTVGAQSDSDPDSQDEAVAASAPATRHTSGGRSPGALKQFWWDLLPKNSPNWLVPPRSGLVEPTINTEWITEDIAAEPQALEQTRRAHDLELARVDSLESKSSGMVTLCLTLLAIYRAWDRGLPGRLLTRAPPWLVVAPRSCRGVRGLSRPCSHRRAGGSARGYLQVGRC